MKPLPLHGRAICVAGMADMGKRTVVRVRSPRRDRGTGGSYDVALIRNPDDALAADSAGFRAACYLGSTAQSGSGHTFAEWVSLPDAFDYLDDGDIIGLQPASGQFRVLYRLASRHNAFLVTERCNHYCLMCSQPPRDVDDSWIVDEIAQAIQLVDPATLSIGFTGGEPLLDWRRFIPLLALAGKALPQTKVHVLTNGRMFALPEVVSAWAAVGHPALCAGIPIYAAVDHIHDYVVQARGAFDETVLGILRLKDKGQRIEVRVVLHRITAPRLLETCEWIARNLSFVDHVALMGLENTGFAIANQDLLWIDPVDYRDDLAASVKLLSASGVNVSVYNLPLCLVDRSIQPFAVQSISDWKNAYLPFCENCSVREQCAGFFSTGRFRESRGLGPIETD